MLICTLGDLLLDVVVTGSGPVQTAADTYSAITVAPGGQAANVAAWVAALGGEARLVTKRAGDIAGKVLLDELTQRGVEVVGPEVAAGDVARTGVVVSLSGFGGERSMLTDRGVSPALRADELRSEWFAGCQWLHLPLYSLAGAPIRQAALKALQWVGPSCRTSLDLSSITVAKQLGRQEMTRLLSLVRPEVVFATSEEAGTVDLSTTASVVVKLGRQGALVNGALHPACLTDVLDTTGAGDAFAAGFLLGGTDLALAAAARAVAQRGAMPLGALT